MRRILEEGSLVGVLTLSIVQAILSEGKAKCNYKAFVLGQTSSQVSLIVVVTVDMVAANVDVVTDNVVDYVVVVDVVDTVVADMVAERE